MGAPKPSLTRILVDGGGWREGDVHEGLIVDVQQCLESPTTCSPSSFACNHRKLGCASTSISESCLVDFVIPVMKWIDVEYRTCMYCQRFSSVYGGCMFRRKKRRLFSLAGDAVVMSPAMVESTTPAVHRHSHGGYAIALVLDVSVILKPSTWLLPASFGFE